MAPEQMLGKPVDARTDIYAMGCVLHYILLGVPPFERDSAIATGMAHCQERPVSLLNRRPELPAGWDSLVMRALEKSADQRFQSVPDLQAALEKL
jgi:serine/threonine-protein kinase